MAVEWKTLRPLRVKAGFLLLNGVILLALTAGTPDKPAVKDAPAYTPPAIHAEVSYRTQAGGRPALVESLSESKVVVKGTSVERVIQGKVKYLPYTFYVRVTRTGAEDKGLLEINVVDPATGKSLEGFPNKRKNFLEGALPVADFQVPVSDQLGKKIGKELLDKGQDLIVINVVIKTGP